MNYRGAVLQLTRIPFERQRANLLNLFHKTFGAHDSKRKLNLVDIGGITEGFESLCEEYEATVVNIEVRKKVNGWNIILADGRYLPFRDEGVDIVVSNALLEHVNQGREELVREVRRVSRGGYFVSVPYLYSPLEPHYLIPFFQFVPESLKRFLLLRIGLTLGWMSVNNYQEIRLFTKSRLRNLFPEAKMHLLRCFGIPVSLVVWSRQGL